MARAKVQPILPSDSLKQLTQLANLARSAEQEIESLEEQVKASKARLTDIVEEDIPMLMAELGIESFKLEDGSSITVGDEVYASIPAASKEAAFLWLEQHNFGSLIKTDVSVSFGREQLEAAVALHARLTEEGLAPEISRGVHASTLKSFLKEQLAAAAEIPLDLFGARPVREAKIKAPRKTKEK